MKIRDPWKASFEQSSPEALSEKIRAMAHAEMREKRAREGSVFLFPSWQPALMALGIGAAAVFFVFKAGSWSQGPAPSAGVTAQFTEMMRDRQMLKDLQLLRNGDLWGRLEKEKWAKKKS